METELIYMIGSGILGIMFGVVVIMLWERATR